MKPSPWRRWAPIRLLNAFTGKKIDGVVLSDQVKSLDWHVRKAAFVEKAGSAVVEEVQTKLMLLIE